MGYWNRKLKGFVPKQDEDTTATNYTDEQIKAMYAQGNVITGEDGEPIVVPRPQPTAEEKQTQYERRVDELIREKYTLSQELAIIRQQATKSAEYNAYFEYCEECKAKSRAEVYGNEIQYTRLDSATA